MATLWACAGRWLPSSWSGITCCIDRSVGRAPTSGITDLSGYQDDLSGYQDVAAFQASLAWSFPRQPFPFGVLPYLGVERRFCPRTADRLVVIRLCTSRHPAGGPVSSSRNVSGYGLWRDCGSVVASCIQHDVGLFGLCSQFLGNIDTGDNNDDELQEEYEEMSERVIYDGLQLCHKEAGEE